MYPFDDVSMGKFDKAYLPPYTVHPKKYAHGFVVLCFLVVMQSFIMNSHEVFIHIHQGCFAGTGAIVRLPQCQWSKPDGYGKISQCITTTKHSKARTVCIFLGIYCSFPVLWNWFYPVWSFYIDNIIVIKITPNNINCDHNYILIIVSITTLFTLIIIITIALENFASSAALSLPHCWLIKQ